jgi:hypothetical protein
MSTSVMNNRVNIMKIFRNLAVTLFIVMMSSAYAQETRENKPDEVPDYEYRGLEVPQAKIRQSSDGSGIIQGVSCDGCDFKFVKITPNTKVILDGKLVDLLTAREYAGKLVYVVFDHDTAEVIKIYL